MNNTATVFLVDDDSSVRASISLFLESEGINVRKYDSARSFLNNYRIEWPGCLVLDIRMPGMSGLELQEVMKSRHISLPIIFLTGHGDVPMAAKAFKRGAVDFLQKPFNARELLERIQQAFSLDAQLRINNDVLRQYSSLTNREKEVMAYVVSGKSNKAIAKELGLSHRTVDVYRARTMEKMGAKSLPDLVQMAALCEVS